MRPLSSPPQLTSGLATGSSSSPLPHGGARAGRFNFRRLADSAGEPSEERELPIPSTANGRTESDVPALGQGSRLICRSSILDFVAKQIFRRGRKRQLLPLASLQQGVIQQFTISSNAGLQSPPNSIRQATLQADPLHKLDERANLCRSLLPGRIECEERKALSWPVGEEIYELATLEKMLRAQWR